MKREQFHFDLPESLIAYYPEAIRTHSRLLCLDGKSGELQHRHFYDVLELFEPGDLLVLNDTKVLPARMYGRKQTGGKVEILVERIVDKQSAWVHCKASKRPIVNSFLILEEMIQAIVCDDKDGLLLLQFLECNSIIDLFDKQGSMPLPPYIRRAAEVSDKDRYQTVYAKHDGSVAAPTAGLHFDQALLEALKNKGVNIAYVTLHVGAGTFQPVRVDDIASHVMHSEFAVLSPAVCQMIQDTKAHGKCVIGVGTTTVRTLESAALKGEIQPFEGETNLFITPGFQFRVIDAMITNFHLPESTLIMLVCALGGFESVMNAYRIAVENQYRFFSYGDAMFISRNPHEI